MHAITLKMFALSTEIKQFWQQYLLSFNKILFIDVLWSKDPVVEQVAGHKNDTDAAAQASKEQTDPGADHVEVRWKRKRIDVVRLTIDTCVCIHRYILEINGVNYDFIQEKVSRYCRD